MVEASNTAANAAGQLSSASRETYFLTDGNVRIPVEPGQKVTVKPQAGQRFRLVKRPPYMVDENVGEVVAVATEAGDAADLVLMADNGGQVVLDGFYSTDAFVELATSDGGVFVIDRTTSAIQVGADGSRLIHSSGNWSALQGLSSSFAAQYEVLNGAFLLQGISVPPSLGCRSDCYRQGCAKRGWAHLCHLRSDHRRFQCQPCDRAWNDICRYLIG